MTPQRFDCSKVRSVEDDIFLLQSLSLLRLRASYMQSKADSAPVSHPLVLQQLQGYVRLRATAPWPM